LHVGFWWTKLKERDNLHKWADNIKMNLKEIGWEGMEWINLA